GEEHRGQDTPDERPNIADLLGEANGKLFFGLGFGFVGRIHEPRIDRRRDSPGLPRVGDALDVPAGAALVSLARLIEVRAVDQDYVGVDSYCRVVSIHDAHQIKLPTHAPVGFWVDLRANWHLLAQLPAVALNQTPAGHGASARLDKCLALVVRNRELVVH